MSCLHKLCLPSAVTLLNFLEHLARVLRESKLQNKLYQQINNWDKQIQRCSSATSTLRTACKLSLSSWLLNVLKRTVRRYH